ncbi:MAG: hypothetical protein AAF288_10350 [Planctomycetota bacterium]
MSFVALSIFIGLPALGPRLPLPLQAPAAVGRSMLLTGVSTLVAAEQIDRARNPDRHRVEGAFIPVEAQPEEAEREVALEAVEAPAPFVIVDDEFAPVEAGEARVEEAEAAP